MILPQVKIITSPKNPLIGEFRRHFSPGGSRKSPLFPVEGPTLALEALQSGLHMEALLVSGESAGRSAVFEALQASPGPPPALYQTGARLLSKAAATEHPQGVLALFHKPHALAPGAIGSERLPVLALIDLQDPGNCGALLRSFLAFGGKQVLTVGATADLYGSKCVRASAGAVFRTECLHLAAPEEMLKIAVDCGLPCVGTTPDSGHRPDECSTPPPFLLLIGNEGSGVPEILLEACREKLSLPMSPTMESLNAAVAGSLVLYELSRSLGLGPFAADR
jgi:RNA methyltransferase, TrmH family